MIISDKKAKYVLNLECFLYINCSMLKVKNNYQYTYKYFLKNIMYRFFTEENKI